MSTGSCRSSTSAAGPRPRRAHAGTACRGSAGRERDQGTKSFSGHERRFWNRATTSTAAWSLPCTSRCPGAAVCCAATRGRSSLKRARLPAAGSLGRSALTRLDGEGWMGHHAGPLADSPRRARPTVREALRCGGLGRARPAELRVSGVLLPCRGHADTAAHAVGAPGRASRCAGGDEQRGRRLALPQPEDDRLPPRPRLPQAGDPLASRACTHLRPR